MVDVTHDRDDRRATNQILGVVFHLIDDLLDIRIGHAHNLVTELLDNQLRGIGINRLRLGRHDTVVHQRLHNIRHPLGHPNSQFRDRNRLWQGHVAVNLFALRRHTHRLRPGAVLLALHRRHRSLTTTCTARHRIIQRQLARAAVIFPTAWLGLGVILATVRFFTIRVAWGGTWA